MKRPGCAGPHGAGVAPRGYARPVVAQRCYWRAGVRVCRSTNSQTVVVFVLCVVKVNIVIKFVWSWGALALKLLKRRPGQLPLGRAFCLIDVRRDSADAQQTQATRTRANAGPEARS